MRNSFRFFTNTECEYYPCHKEVTELNCLFCYCPLYSRKNCPGNYHYIEVNGKQIKACEDCTFPHKAENYDVIMKILSTEAVGE